MFERFFYKQPKLNTTSQIRKALQKEMKKRDKLQKRSDGLLSQMKERETKYEQYYKVKIKEFQEQGLQKEASKLQSESLENNRIYGFIKQDYAKAEHQLMFAKNNVARYEKLLQEKETTKQIS